MHLGLYPTTTTTVTTHIIVTTSMLTLTNVELEALVETELANNPALEMKESQRCDRCGRIIDKPPCHYCIQELLAGTSINIENGTRPGPAATRNSYSDDFDPMQSVVQPLRLADHIMQQLQTNLEPEEIAIGRYLSEALDEKGFLAVTLQQAAYVLNVREEQVEKVLLEMQLVDPVGVGSRNTQECLLRQLQALPKEPETENLIPIGQKILENYWDDFLHGRWGSITIPSQQVNAAIAFIRSNLTPWPALAGWEEEMTRRQGPADSVQYNRPDMAFYYDGDGSLAAEIFTIKSNWLRLSPSFFDMLRSSNGNKQESWVEMADSARLFIKCLGQRQQTLSRAVEKLVNYQEEAIRHGDAHMRELTRTQLARELGVHEATVSRAINGKTAAMPDGRIIPLSHFFESGKSTKEMIRQMVEDEPLPLSDSAIANRLKKMGHPIARRTVAKYRNMLGILPVHLRARKENVNRVTG